MRMHGPLIVVTAAAIVSISSFSGSTVAQTTDASVIADNDSVYIDAKSFTIVPGKAKGGTSALIDSLNARKLGPGAIVFRSGDELYIADARPVILAQLENRYGSDRYGSDRYGSDRYGSDRYGSDRYGSDRYGSDRYGSDRYGSDRDTSVSAAQAERDWQEYLRQNRRYGSDRYGSDRYGSDRYGSDRYGSDRDTSVSTAQAERDWQEYLRQNNRYGSDRYGSDRYGSDRYGSDRDTSVSAAQAERDWQESLRQNSRYGSDRYGSDRSGSDPAQQRIYINDPEYAQYKLKKLFEDNWTSSDSK